MWHSRTDSYTYNDICTLLSRLCMHSLVLFVSAQLLRTLGRREECMASYARALELNPRSTVSLNDVACAHLDACRYDQALEVNTHSRIHSYRHALPLFTFSMVGSDARRTDSTPNAYNLSAHMSHQMHTIYLPICHTKCIHFICPYVTPNAYTLSAHMSHFLSLAFRSDSCHSFIRCVGSYLIARWQSSPKTSCCSTIAGVCCSRWIALRRRRKRLRASRARSRKTPPPGIAWARA